MPSNFSRFRLLNDTPDDANGRKVTSATIKTGTPEVLYTVVGFGTQFSELPPQYYAELDLPEGAVQSDKVRVTLVLTDAAGGKIDITDWKIEVAPAVLLRSVDVKIFFKAANDYRARATAAGANYAFVEPTPATKF